MDTSKCYGGTDGGSAFYIRCVGSMLRIDMDIAIIFKIAAVGIIVTILGQVLKQSGRDEQAFLMTLVGLIIVMFWVVPYISELFQTMETLFMLG